MIGVRGHLVASAVLDALDARGGLPRPHDAMARRLAAWRAGCQPLGPASSLRAMSEVGAEPLVRLLGFSGLDRIEDHKDWTGATLAGASPPLALITTSWGDTLEHWWRTAVVFARQRAADWCVLFNGTHLRLTDARRMYARRWIEVDLDLAADDERARGSLFGLFGHEALSRSGGSPSAVEALVSASEQQGAAVCRALRDGVLTASGDVLTALLGTSRRAALDDSFEQALTLVYRIVFLLFAEARALVPMWHPVYRDSYSVESLRASAEGRRASPGMWDALRAISRIAHRGCRAGDLQVTAFNGRLFAPGRTSLVERHALDDDLARRAVLALATRPAPDGAGRERIAYGDLGVEQLGAVYETLLDYQPRVENGEPASDGGRRRSTHLQPPRARPRVTLQRGSGRRKATGSFYTPQPIAQYLVRRTLAPLVDDAPPQRLLALRIVDPAMGSGAFLVAACDYLAVAYAQALVREGGCHPSDFGPAEHAAIRRTIAERCLYGVDVNPMAVQLARLSLWLLTLAADRPLTFLDHHIRTGDSLLGTWMSNLRQAPQPRRQPAGASGLPLFDDLALGDALRGALPVRFALAASPDDTVDQVRQKERALAALNGRDTPLSKWKRIADLWCAHWFWSGARPPASAFGPLADEILNGASALPPRVASPLLDASERVARMRRFFHWELECPEVFFDAAGARLPAPGFDAVLGNPPWDMLRTDSGPDARAVVQFTRESGTYVAQSDGHANRYQLFLERAVALTRPGGRIGLVLPSGVTADHGSSRLRRMLFARCDVDAITGFDNRNGVFPIHRGVRFVLLTATGGQPTAAFECRLGLRSRASLETDDEPAPLRLTPAILERFTGTELALPELRSPLDLSIAERAASLFPPLGDPGGWHVHFGRELNASDDRDRFQPPGCGSPVIEGKQLQPFRVAASDARWSIAPDDAAELLGERHRRPRLAYRDVASSTNRLTLIAALLPADVVTTHTIFCLRTPLSHRDQHALCGLFNSLVVNYLVRLRVITHVTTAIVERLPIPRREDAPRALREISAIARAIPNADRQATVGRIGDRTAMLAHLNALVAEIYQLTDAEFTHVLDTFPLVPRGERDAALAVFQKRRVCAR